MKNKFIILGMIVLLALMPLANVFAAPGDTAVATLTANVGENPTNSGIRISATTSAMGTDALFDARFLASNSTISLANPTSDFSSAEVTGNFLILVRRQSATGLNVAITATPLTDGTNFAPYNLVSGTLVSISVPISGNGTGSYTIPTASPIIRDSKLFTYTIPVAPSAPLGAYSSTITYYLSII